MGAAAVLETAAETPPIRKSTRNPYELLAAVEVSVQLELLFRYVAQPELLFRQLRSPSSRASPAKAASSQCIAGSLKNGSANAIEIN
jgi:hypothetical protein